MTDPYKSPVAEVDMVQAGSKFTSMPRLHTLIAFIFLVASFGLYAPYWLITRASRFNVIYPIGSVSMQFTFIVCALFLASFAMDLIDIVTGLGGRELGLTVKYSTLYLTLSIAGSVAMLVWVFYFRHKLNNYLIAEVNSFSTIGGFLTFFFGIIYLNFKINQTIDDLSQTKLSG